MLAFRRYPWHPYRPPSAHIIVIHSSRPCFLSDIRQPWRSALPNHSNKRTGHHVITLHRHFVKYKRWLNDQKHIARHRKAQYSHGVDNHGHFTSTQLCMNWQVYLHSRNLNAKFNACQFVLWVPYLELRDFEIDKSAWTHLHWYERCCETLKSRRINLMKKSTFAHWLALQDEKCVLDGKST